MKKYKEGDIILRNKRTFICELASDTKAIFQAMGICEFGGNGCGHNDSDYPSCNEFFILDEKGPFACTKTLAKSGALEAAFPTNFPVVGYREPVRCGKTYIDLNTLSYYYPELTKELLERKLAKYTPKAPGIDLSIGVKKPVISAGAVQATFSSPKKKPAKKAIKKATKSKRA